MNERRGDQLWSTLLMVIVAIDILFKRRRHELTLSQRTRVRIRTDTKRGRLVFAVSWTSFFVWFLVHILRHPWNYREVTDAVQGLLEETQV